MEQIVQGLLNGALQVTHRVSADQRNWTAICNEDCVEDAIRELISRITTTNLEQAEIQKESSMRDMEHQEKTGKFDLQKVNRGITEQLKTANELSEANYNLNILRHLLASIASNKKKIINLEQPVNVQRHADDEDQFIEPAAISRSRKLRDYKKAIAVLVLTICAGIGYYCYDQYNQNKIVEQKKLEKELAEKKFQEKILALYDRILQLPAAERKVTNPKALLQVSEALLKQNELSEVQKINERVLSLTQNSMDRSKAYTINGMAKMSVNKWTAASVDFDQALKEDPTSVDALYQQGISLLNQELYPDAEKFLLKAMESGANKALAGLALFEAAFKIEAAAQDSKFERLSRVELLLQDYTQNHSDLKAEILVARIDIAKVVKDAARADKLTHEFIDINPDTIQKEKSRSQFSLKRVAWTNIYAWCSDAYGRSKNDGAADAMLAGCLLQIHKNSDAVQFAKLGNQRLPADNLIKGMLGYTMQAANLNEDVKTLFKADDEKTLSRLAIVSLARICDKEKTSDCSYKYWSLLSQKDKSDPAAFLGLMNFYIEKSDFAAAEKMVHENISRQPASEDLDKLSAKLKVKGHPLW